MLLERNGACRLNEPMDFLAQAIADLAALVTFQQRRPAERVDEPEDSEETSCRLRLLPQSTRETGIAQPYNHRITDSRLTS